MNKKFLYRYLVDIADRFLMVAFIVSVMFWLVGIIWLSRTFEGTVGDIILVTVGMVSTIFSTFCPSSHIFEKYDKYYPELAKRAWIADILNSLNFFACLQVIAGIIVYLSDLISGYHSSFTMVPEVFGIIGVLILLFCPTADQIEA